MSVGPPTLIRIGRFEGTFGGGGGGGFEFDGGAFEDD